MSSDFFAKARVQSQVQVEHQVDAADDMHSHLQTSFLVNVLCCLDRPLPFVGVWKAISLLLLSLKQQACAVMSPYLVKTSGAGKIKQSGT